MLNSVYCVSCRKPLDPSWSNCPHCGVAQKPPVQSSSPSPVIPTQQPLPPVYVVQSVANPQLIVEECTRQYRNLNWLAFAGIFLLGAYLIGLAMIIYSMVQKPAFRRKIAELGMDPEAWEKPLRAEYGRIMLIGIVLATVAGGLIFGFIYYSSVSTATPPISSDSGPP